MEITVKAITDSNIMLNTARVTVWKDDLLKEPTDKFMRNMYFSEHSPIYTKFFLIEIKGIKSWIATHFVRHSVGYTPFVSTQRDDRHPNNTPRDELKQGELVNISIVLDAESFISVSRKRLCNMAHKETRDVWNSVIDKLRTTDKNLADCCVRNCVYRNGICSEGNKCCNFNKTEEFKSELSHYLEGRNI